MAAHADGPGNGPMKRLLQLFLYSATYEMFGKDGNYCDMFGNRAVIALLFEAV
jgi:hypothetical protein